MKEVRKEHVREVKQKDGGSARVWLVQYVNLLEPGSRWAVSRIEFDIDGVSPLNDPNDGSYATEEEALAVTQQIVDEVSG